MYVFHKTLKEIEDFFITLQTKIDSNPIIHHLINEILNRESIKLSFDNQNELSFEMGKKLASAKKERISMTGEVVEESFSATKGNLNLYKDLDILSVNITDALFLLLNDPFYHCSNIYKFFNSHQLFQIMPIV